MSSRKDYYTYTHLFTLAGFGASGNSNFEHWYLKADSAEYLRRSVLDLNV